MSHWIVIGAGVLGLAAACELVTAGTRVTPVEAVRPAARPAAVWAGRPPAGWTPEWAVAVETPTNAGWK